MGGRPWMHCEDKLKGLDWKTEKLFWLRLYILSIYTERLIGPQIFDQDRNCIVSMSLLFLLALNGSVNHEVGEINVTLSFFCLQNRHWTTASIKTLQWFQTTSCITCHWHATGVFCCFCHATGTWIRLDVGDILPVNQTCQLRMPLSETISDTFTFRKCSNAQSVCQADRETATEDDSSATPSASHHICHSQGVNAYNQLNTIKAVLGSWFFLLWFAKNTKQYNACIYSVISRVCVEHSRS